MLWQGEEILIKVIFICSIGRKMNLLRNKLGYGYGGRKGSIT